MNKVIMIAMALMMTGIAVRAQYDKCGPSLPYVGIYYMHQPNSKFGFGIEAGTQGTESGFGLYAGYHFSKYANGANKNDSTGFSTKGSLYLKGAYRLTTYGSYPSVFLTAAPELSVQTGFDVKAGMRVMLPLHGKKGIGLEPSYAVKQKTFSLNIIAAF